MTHPFEIGQETTLPASPEEVWEAITTGPGIDSWFMGRNEVEPREGGAVVDQVLGRVLRHLHIGGHGQADDAAEHR
ncbi:hypothetical protein ABZS62_38215, partial [Streptomyces sp900116325]